MRAGNFSSAAAQLIDPVTGLPLPGNAIPSALLSPAAVALLRYIPAANVPGGTRNYHYTTTTDSLGDNLSLRVTHNFTPPPAGARGGGGGGRGAFGGRGGAGGRGGRGNQGTTVLLNAQMQYRRSDNERVNVFPTLGGVNESSTFALPVSLNVARRRTLHNISVNYSRTTGASINRYAYVEDVAGNAGITGVATDPFDWGVPSLSFSTFSGVRDLDPTERDDRRWAVAYTWTRPIRQHTLRFGGDYRWDVSKTRTDANARGAFVFTGLYAHRRRAGRPQRRARFRGLPARPAAAGRRAVRARHGRARRPLDEPLRPGRLAEELARSPSTSGCATNCSGRSPNRTARWSTSMRRPTSPMSPRSSREAPAPTPARSRTR